MKTLTRIDSGTNQTILYITLELKPKTIMTANSIHAATAAALFNDQWLIRRIKVCTELSVIGLLSDAQ